MKCIVLGGGGFIGSHVTDALLQEPEFQVTVFDRPGANYLDLLKDKGARIILGDFLNVRDLVHAIQGNDIIFHLVSTTVPSYSNDHVIFDVESNIIGSLNLLDVAKEAGVHKVIFSSSGGTVYGNPETPVITETSTGNYTVWIIAFFASQMHMVKGKCPVEYKALSLQ
jgi:UDP-glucose 4-epimerase